MLAMRWLRNWKTASKRIAGQRQRASRIEIEPLEARVLLSGYTAIDLGTLGGTTSSAEAMNDSDQVVGQSATAGGKQHAFLWQNGAMTDLGTLGGNSSKATDINNAGQVVGFADWTTQPNSSGQAMPPHAFLWQNGTMTDLMPGGGEGRAYGVNNSGQIVGDANTNGVSGAFVWENGVMYDLDNLLPSGSGISLIAARDINVQGQIVGWGNFNGSISTFLLTDDDGVFANGGAVVSTMGDGLFGHADGLNNTGDAVGWIEFIGDATDHATVFSHGQWSDIGFDEATSSASEINDAGQVVGTIYEWSRPNPDHAFLWQNGQRTYLQDHIQPASGLTLISANDINEDGDIVGQGTIGGKNHAFLLTESSVPLPATLSVGDVSITEGNTGTRIANFTVSLTNAGDRPVSVAYATVNGSATAGSDYQSATGTLTFDPGQTSKIVAVVVNGDTTNEANETLFLNLSNPVDAVFADSQAMATILNDDAAPTLAINDVSRTEGNSGTVNFVFTVSLSNSSDTAVTVNVATANGTAKTTDNDYAAASGAVTFNPGETSKTFTVRGNGDRRAETNETFFVNLSGATNALISDSQGTGTIVDDEPRISISDVSRTEGRSGTTSFVFTVTLSAAYDAPVTVNYSTARGTTSSDDFASKSGKLTFAPGETSKTITVLVNGDRKKESNETFFVNLTSPTNASILDAQGLGTILNDD